MFYVTTGKVLEDVNLEARATTAKIDLEHTGLFREVSFYLVGKDVLQRMYQRSKNSVSAKFNFLSKVTIGGEIAGVSQAYSGFLPWSEFKKIVVSDSGSLQRSLFFDNVRDWQEYNEVNSEIRQTLQSATKDRFILMNNGVTVIAKSMQVTGNEFVLDDFQIVNGCQTSHVLYDQRDLLDDSILIPFRLISTKDEDVTNSIIRATNRQTVVREDQFFALEEFGKTLELFFSSFPPAQRLYFERRSKQFESLNIEKTRVTTFANMIRAFASMFLNEPHRATRNYAALRNKVGREIFAQDQRMEPYFVAALALYKLEFFFRNGKLGSQYKPARFHILLAIRILGAGYEMPSLKANKMEGYCKGLTAILQDSVRSEEYITKAAQIVETAANGNFERDSIRTEPFTELVVKLSSEESSKLEVNCAI